MKAFLLSSERTLAPFGDPVGRSQVLGRDLRVLLDEELRAAGFEPVEQLPAAEPYLLLSDRTWITAALLRRFREQATAPARLRIEDESWLELTEALQDWPERGVYEVALLPAGASPDFSQLPAVTIDPQVRLEPGPDAHPAFAHAMPAQVPQTDAAVHQIDHWSHLLRVNWLAMSATIQRERRTFERDNPLVKLWKLLGVALRVRSFSVAGVARALCQVGRNCRIHPTAVLEASVLGDDVEIGPYAVVRASVLGDGARVEEHTTVNMSVVGAGARVGRYGMANLCVLYPGAFIGGGDGHQACIFGRDSWLALSVTTFDLAFDKPIRVWHRGARVSSGTWFLGSCVGHRARIGAHVRLGYGAEVPNDAFVVGPSDDVLRSWVEGAGPHRVSAGKALPLRGSPAQGEPLGAEAEKEPPCPTDEA